MAWERQEPHRHAGSGAQEANGEGRDQGRDRGRPASPAGSPRARPGHAGHVHRVNPREAPTGCLRSNPRSEARAHLRKLRLSCSDLKPGYTKGPPCASLGRFLCDLVQGRAAPETQTSEAKIKGKSASGGLRGRSPRGRRLGEEHPQPPARSVGVVPGRQGQAAARSLRDLDPHPSDSAPQAPARASGAFFSEGRVKGLVRPAAP